MRYRTIPDTLLTPSVICLGLCDHGTTISRDASWRRLDTFAELGGSFLDRAHVYAAWQPDGEGASERNLGAWLQSRGPRAQRVGATKSACADYPRADTPRLHAEGITHDLLVSLERLRLDAAHVYWMHRDDAQAPVGDPGRAEGVHGCRAGERHGGLELAARHGCTANEVALAYLLQRRLRCTPSSAAARRRKCAPVARPWTCTWTTQS